MPTVTETNTGAPTVSKTKTEKVKEMEPGAYGLSGAFKYHLELI